MNLHAIRSFLKKQGFQSGISLLEAVIALALLAFVLLTSVLVRFTVNKTDIAKVDELSASALLRQCCMEYQSGLITNDFAETNVTNMSESGSIYYLYGALHTNDLLGIQRIDLQLAIKDDSGNSKVSTFRSRWKYLPTNMRITPAEPPGMDTSPSLLTLHVYVTNTSSAKGTVQITGVSTNDTNDAWATNVYGTIYTIVATPKTGFTFKTWLCHSDGRFTNDLSSMTNTNAILDEDREIEAVFQP